MRFLLPIDLQRVAKLSFFGALLLLLTVTLQPQPAFAAKKNCTEVSVDIADVRSKALGVLQDLSAQGWTQLGEVELDQLAEVVRTVEIDTSCTKSVQVNSATFPTHWRFSGYYQPGEKVFLFPDRSQDVADPHFPYLLLHEVLGFMGFDDRAYQLTTLMLVLNENKDGDPLVSDYLRNEILPPSRSVVFVTADRGGTSVGGGGDVHGLAVKAKLVTLWLKSRLHPLIQQDFDDDRFAAATTRLLKVNVEASVAPTGAVGYKSMAKILTTCDRRGTSILAYLYYDEFLWTFRTSQPRLEVSDEKLLQFLNETLHSNRLFERNCPWF